MFVFIFFRPVPPMVMWAQRPNLIFLTICVEDCKEPVINVEPSKLFFKGVGGPDKKQHELTINFFGEIDKEVSKIKKKYEITRKCSYYLN